MKNLIFDFVFIIFLAFCVSAQTADVARLFDEFPRLPCGDFESRMSGISAEIQNSPDSKIYVVYYGGRFRKENSWNEKTKRRDKVILKYPHHDDGLNWAKSIPLYLTTENSYPEAIRNLFKDKIILINGGFREDIGVEIWIAPKNAQPPKPTPTIAESDIKFGESNPRKVADYTKCYDDYP